MNQPVSRTCNKMCTKYLSIILLCLFISYSAAKIVNEEHVKQSSDNKQQDIMNHFEDKMESLFSIWRRETNQKQENSKKSIIDELEQYIDGKLNKLELSHPDKLNQNMNCNLEEIERKLDGIEKVMHEINATMASKAAAASPAAAGAEPLLVEFNVRGYFTLNCSVPGNVNVNVNAVTFSWKKNDTPVQLVSDLAQRYKLEENGAVFKLVARASEDDFGNYTCLIDGNVARAWRVHALNIARLPSDSSVVEGQKVQLTCKLIGKPYARVAWLYSAAEGGTAANVASTHGSRVTVSDSAAGVPSGVLELQAAERGDTGVYTCAPAAGDPATTFLHVKELEIESKINAEIPATTWFYEPTPHSFDYDYSEKAEGWLKLHVEPATWQVARLRCHSEGAVIASPLTIQLKEAIIEFVSNKKQSLKSPKMIFTGVHATSSQGDYNSIEGVPLSRLSVTWAPGEPNKLHNSESCLVMDAEADNIADTSCGNVFPFVCYKTFQNACGTSDPEYRLYAATGSCYKLHKSEKAWSGAFRTCAGEGAHLAILNSEQEAKYLGGLMRGLWAHIGFHDWGSYGSSWKTIDGKTLAEAGYSEWKAGEPNNMTYYPTGETGEYCGSMDDNGEINDMPCNVRYPFWCELTPGSLM